MNLFSNHKLWWVLLIVATIIVSIVTTHQFTLLGLLMSVAGHLVFSIVAATIPLVFYWLIGRPLNTEEMMSTITVGWLILAVANLWVMP
jgi:hypothetical protein